MGASAVSITGYKILDPYQPSWILLEGTEIPGSIITSRLFHPLLESEHTVHLIFGTLRIWIIGVGMVAVEELYDMESAAVHIEVDVTLLEVRRYRLPYFDLRVQPLHLAPCLIADTSAMCRGQYEQQLELAMLAVCLYYNATDLLAISRCQE